MLHANLVRVRLLALLVQVAAGCTDCPYGNECRPLWQSDLARMGVDPWCDTIWIHMKPFEDLDGLQGAAKAVVAFENDVLADVSAIDSARSVELRDNPALEVVRAIASNHDVSSIVDSSRELHLGLLPPLPNVPGETFPEPVNSVLTGHMGRGPDVLDIYCATPPCRARVFISANTFEAADISVEGVTVVNLSIWSAPLSSWEFLQGFGVPEQGSSSRRRKISRSSARGAPGSTPTASPARSASASRGKSASRSPPRNHSATVTSPPDRHSQLR